MKLNLNNSIICLDDLVDTIACRLDMYLIFERLNIRKLKEEILARASPIENYYENSAV
jgi:hypothetical protein